MMTFRSILSLVSVRAELYDDVTTVKSLFVIFVWLLLRINHDDVVSIHFLISDKMEIYDILCGCELARTIIREENLVFKISK